MKKRINFGAFAFLIVFVLIVIFLVTFGILHSVESKKINTDLRNELMNKYSIDLYKIESEVHFTAKDKATVDIGVTFKIDNNSRTENVTVTAEKKDGKWTVTFAPYDLSQMGKISVEKDYSFAEEVLF